MRLAFYLGRVTRGAVKAVLPVAKWTTQQASTIVSEFNRGITHKPTIIATDESYEEHVSSFEKKLDAVDEEIRKELAEEQVQPELPGMNLQQPTRES